MDYNVWPNYSSLCNCDCSIPLIIRRPATPPPPTIYTESTQPVSCCSCNYNPFNDESNEHEINDHSFAIRKLSAMKCQLKKWKVERLKLESDNRYLKRQLQSFGVNVNEPLKTDPLIIHYQEENIRLEKIKEQLEDKIKDLEEALMVGDLYKNSCEGVQKIQQKIQALHEQSRQEKKVLYDEIAELRMKLVLGDEKIPSNSGVKLLDSQQLGLMMDKDKNSFGLVKQDEKDALINVEKSIDTIISNKNVEDLKVVKNYDKNGEEKEDVEIVKLQSELFGKSLTIIDKKKSDDSNIIELESSRIIREEKDNEKKTQDGKNKNDDDDDDDDDKKIVEEKLTESRKSFDSIKSISTFKNIDDDAGKIIVELLNEKLLNIFNNKLLVEENFKEKLVEKDKVIESLEKNVLDNIDKMTINCSDLMDEVTGVKNYFIKSDIKFQELLNDNVEIIQLKNSIDDVKFKFFNENINSNEGIENSCVNLFNEMCQINKINLEMNDCIIQILEDKLIEFKGKETSDEDEIIKIEDRNEDFQLTKCQDEIKNLQIENENIQNENDKMAFEINKLNELMEEYKNEIDDWKDKYITLENNRNNENEKIEMSTSITGLDNDSNNYNDLLLNFNEIKVKMELLNKENIELKDSFTKRLNNETNDLNSEKDYLNNEINTLNTKLSANKNEIKILENTINKLEDNNVKLLNDIELNEINKIELEKELSLVKGELKELLLRFNEAGKSNSDLFKEHEKLQDELNVIKHDDKLHQQNENQFKLLENKLKELEYENEELKLKVINLEKDNDTYKVQVSEYTLDIDRLHNELNDLRSELSKYQKQVESTKFEMELKLTDQHQQQQQQQQQLQTSQQVTDLQDSQINQLDAQEKGLKLNDESMKDELDNLKRQYKMLNKEKENLKDELTLIKANNNELLNINERMKRNSIADKDNIKLLKSKIDVLTTDNNDLQMDINNLKLLNDDINNKLNNSNVEKNELINELNNVKNDYDNLQREFNNLTDEKLNLMKELTKIDLLNSELIAIKNELNNCRNDKNTYYLELEYLKEQLLKLKKTSNNLDINNIKLNYSNDNNSLKYINENQHLRKSLNILDQKIINLNNDNIDKLNKINELKNKLEIFQSKSNNINKVNERLVHENDELQNEFKRLTKMTLELESRNSNSRLENGDEEAKVVEVVEEEEEIVEENLERTQLELNEMKLRLASTNISQVKEEKKINGDDEDEERDNINLNNNNSNIKIYNSKLNTTNTSMFNQLKYDIEISTIEQKDSLLKEKLFQPSENEKELKNQLETAEQYKVKAREQVPEEEEEEEVDDELDKDVEVEKEVADEQVKSSTPQSKNNILKVNNNNDCNKELINDNKYNETTTEKVSNDVDDDGDLSKALYLLDENMRKQIEGINGIIDEIIYDKGSMINNKLNNSDKQLVLFDNVNDKNKNLIIGMIKLSNDLSSSIKSVKKEMVDMREAWRSCWNENKRLKKLVEDLGISDISKMRKLPQREEMEDVFNPERWLGSLTLTQLADLHEQICSQTSHLVGNDHSPVKNNAKLYLISKDIDNRHYDNDNGDDDNKNEDLEKNYIKINKRIAALQKEISENQIESDNKIIKLNQLLCKEQMKLVKISDVLKRERKRNLAIQFAINQSPRPINNYVKPN